MGCLTCAHIWVRAVHTKGSQAQTSLDKSSVGGTEKLPLTLPRLPGDRTLGSSGLKSDALPTELRPSSPTDLLPDMTVQLVHPTSQCRC